MRTLVAVALILTIVGCVRPIDSRTAVEHEREAQRHRSEMELARSAVVKSEIARPMPSATEATEHPGTSMAAAAAGRVASEQRAAEGHELIARRIREEAALACEPIPPKERRICPVESVQRVERSGAVVRLHLAPTVSAEALRTGIGCAVAESHIERNAEHENCPLFVRGARPRVVDRPEGPVLEIEGETETQAIDVERRAGRCCAGAAR